LNQTEPLATPQLEAQDRKVSKMMRGQASTEKALVASERQRIILEKRVGELEEEIEASKSDLASSQAQLSASQQRSARKPNPQKQQQQQQQDMSKWEEEATLRRSAETERDALRVQVCSRPLPPTPSRRW